jgi:hypothetical protein
MSTQSRSSTLFIAGFAVFATNIGCEHDSYDMQHKNVVPTHSGLRLDHPVFGPWSYVGDQVHTMYRLRYNCGQFLDPCHKDLSDEYIGPGGRHLRQINDSDKEDIFMTFPNGHPPNPETIVFVTAGQQNARGKSDAHTGQGENYKFAGYGEKSKETSVVGNSLYGRLRHYFGTNAYYILVHDNAANGGDPDSQMIHDRFARYIRDKVGPRTERVVVAGFSRGGYLAAHVGKSMRESTADPELPADVDLFVGVFEGVSAYGSGFGVSPWNHESNPLVADPQYTAETTNVLSQVPHTKRRNNTFFYNQVGGGEVTKVVRTPVRAFAATTHEIVPGYWTQRWDTLSHDEFRDYSEQQETFDPFMSWLHEHMTYSANGVLGSRFYNGYADEHGSGTRYYQMARAGGSLTCTAMWDDTVDLDIAVYDKNGDWIGGSYSSEPNREHMDITVPSDGLYSVVVHAHTGSAVFDISCEAHNGDTQAGQITMPSEKLNSQSDYQRHYDIAVGHETGAINLAMTWADSDADLDMELTDPFGYVIGGSHSTTTAESISAKTMTGGTYRLTVYAWNNVSASYDINGTAPIADHN